MSLGLLGLALGNGKSKGGGLLSPLKIGIAGASGFVGSYLIDALLALYEECNNASLLKNQYISTFVDKCKLQCT